MTDHEPWSGDTLWVWQEQEPNGQWGTIAAVVPAVHAAALLVTRSKTIAADQFEAIAREHGRAAGRPVRLAEFRKEQVHAVHTP